MIECVVMAFLAGARQRIGSEQEGAGFLLTRKVRRRADLSMTEHNLELARALGLAPRERGVAISLRPEEIAFGERFWHAHAGPAGVRRVALHPSAQWLGQLHCWPAPRFARLARELTGQTGASIALLGSPSEEGPVPGSRPRRMNRAW